MPAVVERIEIRPQPGPQEQFLATPADWAFYGGSAGSGKSFATIIDPLRHIHRPGFRAVIFRREMTRLVGAGSIWEECEGLYPHLGASSRMSPVLEWQWPSGATCEFRHLQHDKDKHAHQSKQYAAQYWEEITEFEENQFWYLVSRLRTTCGIRPYLRGTCNPDPDSFVRRFIDWWIAPDGFPILDRSGVIRWFARVGDEIVWADSEEQLLAENPGVEPGDPISFTFIAARLKDNPALTEKDPSYRSRLRALPPVERARLLGDEDRGGNWNIRASAGALFQRSWFPILQAPPPPKHQARAWDFAATAPTVDNPDPDWTRGLKGLVTEGGQIVITDLVGARGNPGEVEQLYTRTLEADGQRVTQRIAQDPGEAGKAMVRRRVQLAPKGVTVRAERVTGDKTTRAGPASGKAYAGLISVVKAAWNDAFFAELEAFPDGRHDDIVDCLSDLVDELNSMGPSRIEPIGLAD